MNYKSIVTAPEAIKGFYPTPPELAELLLADLDWRKIRTVLEPSCGKGDLIAGLLKARRKEENQEQNRHRCNFDMPSIKVDGVEIDPALRAACIAEFGEDGCEALAGRRNDLERKINEWDRYREAVEAGDVQRRFGDRIPPETTDEEFAMWKDLREMVWARNRFSFRMVGEDFLRFRTGKQYDLIVMNPPFANGAEHLAKAISMQKRFGGHIRCILNAETIRNPFSMERTVLAGELQELGAEIDYVQDAFLDAERQTGVEVALIKVDIPAPEFDSAIFERMTKAEEREEAEAATPTDLALNDMVSRMVAQFNVEVNSGIELIKAYTALCPHIMEDFDPEGPYKKPLISLQVRDHPLSVNDYVEAVRLKYWRALFNNSEVTGRMTSDLRNKWQSKVNEFVDYDFSVSNIRTIIAEMNVQLADGVKDAIMKLFEEFTIKHSWYPECNSNVHYYTGWSTNKAHYINKKVIMLCGAYARDKIFEKDTFDVHEAVSFLMDIEKVFDYFAGEGVGTMVDLSHVMRAVSNSRYGEIVIPPKNLRCKYFTVTFFKKGTVHITFHDQDLVDRYNIYCAGQSNELPPNYGKVRYDDLSDKEKAVVDGFNGDGTDGSGEAKYTEIYEHQDRYLVQPKQSHQALPGSLS